MTTRYNFLAKKINDDQIKYHFTENQDKKFTYAEVINFLKNKNEDFLETFRASLNSVIQGGIPAYLWQCAPVSNETLSKPFEFVITKSEALNNITQHWLPFGEYISKNHDKYSCSFPNLDKSGTLIIPIPQTGPNLDFKNISEFTENSPKEQWKVLWQEVANKLSEELEKDNDPKWLSTHGLGVSYLHVRIDNSPKYYVWEEYKKLEKNTPEIPRPTPKQIANNPKEKILQNLDKICIDPIGNLANAELLKNWINEKGYSSLEAGEKGFYKVKINTSEEIDLEQFGKFNLGKEAYRQIKEALINGIKQNASDWEIEKMLPESLHSLTLKNKRTGIKHWESGFRDMFISEQKEDDWKEIEAALKKSQTPQKPNSQKEDYQLPFLAKLAIGGVIFVTLIIFIILVVKRNNKQRKKNK